ncbi:cytochrome-c peroxidase [Acidobacteria bacterium AH-259-L09]|nr:cytochrome-c peroxidase [Acidobacteria bacterium AH-259-L09]
MGRQNLSNNLLITATLLAVALLAAFAAAKTAVAPLRPEIPLGLDLYMPVPEDNPLTRDKVELGRKLFSDPILSQDKTLSCAGCHRPERAFTDGRAVSQGVFDRKGTRSVPTLVNRGYGGAFFWDGRISSLEEQVLQPIQDPKEMDMTLEEVVARLKQREDYRHRFREALGTEINAEGLAKALASYVRTILSGDSAFDRYMNGERVALSERERQGLRIFRGKGNCTACHVGPNFTDERFHDTGIAWRDGQLLDPGRFAVTGKEQDRGAFKTPTLREIEHTAPYMHDGSLETLKDVIDFYDRGGNPNPYLDPELRRLALTAEEKKALLAFLRSLDGEINEVWGK